MVSEFLVEPHTSEEGTLAGEACRVVSELGRPVEELSKPLEENERFLTPILHANQIAMRTHQEEK